MNVEISYTDHKPKKGTSNLLNETIHSIVVFKIDAFFVLFNESCKLIALLKI